MPGAETWAEFYVRAGSRLRRIADDHPGESVVVICHGGVVGASFVALGDLSMRMAAQVMADCQNTSMTEWTLQAAEWRLMRYNDHAHLASVTE
jgi:probable phosphoglycerate mutase